MVTHTSDPLDFPAIRRRFVARTLVASWNDDEEGQEGWPVAQIGVLCWRYRGLTGVQKPVYGVAISFWMASAFEGIRVRSSRPILVRDCGDSLTALKEDIP